MKDVNSKFSVLLGQKKMRISDVHRMTGISRTTLTKLYYDFGHAISYTVLAKLCTALGCEVSDILEVNSSDERQSDK